MARVWEPGRWTTGHVRPRVLVEEPDGAVQAAYQKVLTEAGFEVAVCGGPRTMGRRVCPALVDGTCPLVADADVVYCSLRMHEQTSRDILDQLRRSYPDLPIVVEATVPELRRFPELADGPVVHVPATRGTITRAVAAAVASARAERPTAC